jgi:hypothetical protein
MLGDILGGLTEAASADGILAAVGSPDVLERIRLDAAAEGVPAGALVAARVRHMLNHAGEDLWLDLLGVMSGSPQPGAAALAAMLSLAFPDPAAAVPQLHKGAGWHRQSAD